MAVASARDDFHVYTIMFHQLHNIEEHPSVRASGRTLLTYLLAECLSEAKCATSPTILDIEDFDPDSIKHFIKAKEQLITFQWEAYLSRRRAGAPRELLPDLSGAKTWLRRRAPLRCVDGAWLGHIHKVDTPFHLRAITKNAWQILSEELGDGDLARNHVNVYRDLLRQTGVELPESHDIDFIHPRHGLDDKDAWKAGVVQLLISLHPHEFLPEILGFSLHFESITLETLQAVKELKELDLDATYFLLHICIDNADSGHTAMATEIVLDYVQLVTERHGTRAGLQAWQRIQLGFLLSESLDRSSSASDLASGTSRNSLIALETDLVRIFRAKASVAQKLHSACPMKLNGRKLAEWLDPQAFESKDWQVSFLLALSNAKPWILKGDSQRSKFMKLLGWGGTMFGAFTQTESETLARWIDALGTPPPSLNEDSLGEVVSTHVDKHKDSLSASLTARPKHTAFDFRIETLEPKRMLDPILEIDLTRPVILAKFIPLWFAQSCLLESFVCVPSKTCSTVVAAAIQILRAQHGFVMEGEGVAGMDELHRANVIDLIAIGQDMMTRAGWARVESLTDLLQQGDCEDAIAMLNMSSKPAANQELLIGMCSAFADLHTAMISVKTFSILGADMASHLTTITRREKYGLEICQREFDHDMVKRRRYRRGYQLAKLSLEKCF